MIVYRTGCGTIVFVKIPDNANVWKNESYHVNTLWYKSNDMRNPKHILLPLDDLQLLGLTSEVTEKQLIDVGFGHTDYIEDGLGATDSFVYKLDSFKSLMKHLQVYEINPYTNPVLGDSMSDHPFGLPPDLEDEYFKWQFAKSRTGKWVCLFKPNEK